MGRKISFLNPNQEKEAIKKWNLFKTEYSKEKYKKENSNKQKSTQSRVLKSKSSENSGKQPTRYRIQGALGWILGILMELAIAKHH